MTTDRVALVVIAIVVVILIIFRIWTAAPTTTSSALEQPVDLVAPPSGIVSTYFSTESGEDVIVALTDTDPCADMEQAGTAEPSDLTEEEIGARRAAYERAMERAKERLAVSQDVEHLHIAALLEPDPANRIELISKALMTNRNDAFLMWDAVRICTGVIDQTNCPLEAWEDRLLLIDGQNSEAWIRVAANRLNRGDNDGSLRAMQRAATSAESREYWREAIEATERSLVAVSDLSFPERMSLAFGIAAQNFPPYGDYTKMCQEEGIEDQEWAYACLAYGELLESQSKTLMGQGIAYAFQKIALETLGDEQRFAIVTARQEKARQNRNEWALEARQSEIWTVGLSNPSILYGYLETISNESEMAALVYLQGETDRWLRERREQECTR